MKRAKRISEKEIEKNSLVQKIVREEVNVIEKKELSNYKILWTFPY